MKATEYAMDLDAIGIGAETQALDLDMRCPKIGVDSGVNNWSRKQCTLRVRTGNPCTVRCKFGKEAKAELDATGEDYKLEPDTGSKTAFNRMQMQPLVPPKDPNRKWPGRQKRRNINMAVDLINGWTIPKLIAKYKVKESSIKKLSYQCYLIANPEVFSACPSKTIKLDFARVNKDNILPHLVFIEPNRNEAT